MNSLAICERLIHTLKDSAKNLHDVSEDAARMIVTVWGLGYKFEVPED